MMETSGGTLLDSIVRFCRRVGMAESTFGRRAVNDGKFVSRLRDGARVTPETLDRITAFITRHGGTPPGEMPPELMRLIRVGETPRAAPLAEVHDAQAAQRSFRFYDNRQKYLLFVHTCG